MLKPVLTLSAAALILAAGLAPADAAHRRHHRLGMHALCRADAASAFGVPRGRVSLGPLRRVPGRTLIPGLASYGPYAGARAFTCEFDGRGAFQGAV